MCAWLLPSDSSSLCFFCTDTFHFFSSGSSNVVILFIHPVCLGLHSQCISTGTWEITLRHKLLVCLCSFPSNWKKDQHLERFTHSQQIFAFLSSRQPLQKELVQVGLCHFLDRYELKPLSRYWWQTGFESSSHRFVHVKLVCSSRNYWNIQD